MGAGAGNPMHLFRYSRWDGTHDVEPFTPEDLMEKIADEMLGDGDLRSRTSSGTSSWSIPNAAS